MARRITQKDGADAVAMLDQERSSRKRTRGPGAEQATATNGVPVPHRYLPTTGAKNQPCAECFSVPTDPTFAEHHVIAAKVPAAKSVTPKRTPAKASKAARVRALLDEGKTVLDISKALDDVSWAYAWDVAAAWEKKTGKTVIASHAKVAK